MTGPCISAAVCGAEDLDVVLIHLLDLHRVDRARQKLGMRVDVRLQVGHALGAKFLEQWDDPARIDLGQADRHVVEKVAVAPLARFQFLQSLRFRDIAARLDDG